jgi:hypothetical protein
LAVDSVEALPAVRTVDHTAALVVEVLEVFTAEAHRVEVPTGVQADIRLEEQS